jgi:proteasome lid subunit RPN8/RPN11
MIKISTDAYEAMRKHGEATYPHECCGVLLGRFEEDGSRVVSSAVRCGNMRTDSPQNRYRIDPHELVRIQREGRNRDEDIIGFYHSHPDHPAQWSTTDLTEAHWFGCSYVITAVEKGRAMLTHSFLLMGSEDQEKHFSEERIVLVQNDLAKTAV